MKERARSISKSQIESDCTFIPKVSKFAANFSRRNPFTISSRSDLLYKKGKEYQMRREELARRAGEDKECTFKPNIVSSKTNLSYKEKLFKVNKGSRHETLYNAAKKVAEKKEKLKNDRALKGCTFSPEITKRANQVTRTETQEEKYNRLMKSSQNSEEDREVIYNI